MYHILSICLEWTLNAQNTPPPLLRAEEIQLNGAARPEGNLGRKRPVQNVLVFRR